MTSQWHGGKGSSSRPFSVTQEEYDNRWDLIFGKDKAKVKDHEQEEPIEENDLEEDTDDDESETDTEQE